MLKALVGSGGFAREVKAAMGDKYMLCFVEDKYCKGTDTPMSKFRIKDFQLLVAIGDPLVRRDIVKRISDSAVYFSFMDSQAQILDEETCRFGPGLFIAANSILTTNIDIGNHCQLNLATTIGHDCKIGNYFTTAPGAKISGNCTIGDCVYIGTNSSIKEKISICSNVVIGLNSGVLKDIKEPGVYVGTPARKVKDIYGR